MSLKITIRYEKTEKVSKIQVPKSWASKTVGMQICMSRRGMPRTRTILWSQRTCI